MSMRVGLYDMLFSFEIADKLQLQTQSYILVFFVNIVFKKYRMRGCGGNHSPRKKTKKQKTKKTQTCVKYKLFFNIGQNFT